MSGARSELTAEIGELFTELVAEMEPGTTATLLKTSDDYPEFDELATLNEHWFFEFTKNDRHALVLMIADDTDPMADLVAQATHIRINDEVYVISEGDTTKPLMTEPYWRIYCDLFDRRTNFSTL